MLDNKDKIVEELKSQIKSLEKDLEIKNLKDRVKQLEAQILQPSLTGEDSPSFITLEELGQKLARVLIPVEGDYTTKEYRGTKAYFPPELLSRIFYR